MRHGIYLKFKLSNAVLNIKLQIDFIIFGILGKQVVTSCNYF